MPKILRTDSGGGGGGPVTSSGLTMATDKLLGRDTAGTGAVEELGLGAGLSISGGNLVASATGDVVGPASSVANNIPFFSDTTGKLLKETTTSGRVSINNDGAGAANYWEVYDGDGGVTNFRVSATGVVTINTTSQDGAAKVTIKGAGTTTGKNLSIQTSGGTTTAYFQDNGSLISKGTNTADHNFLRVENGGSAYGLLGQVGAAGVTGGVLTANVSYFLSSGGNLSLLAGGANHILFGTTDTWAEKARISNAGGFSVGTTTDAGAGNILVSGQLKTSTTITATATTGAQTINKQAGRVNFAATDTSLVVTNSLVTADSVVICTVNTNDATLKTVLAVPTAGSFTIHANAAATAETAVSFLVFN